MKNKTLYLAKLQVRSEAVGGGALPDDEMQCDFVISTNDEDQHCSIMTEKTLRNYNEDAQAGVPFVKDHKEGIDTILGRTVASSYDEEQKRTIATVSMLRDSEDTPENMRINEYIRRIERGYYNSVSVAFREAAEKCTICHREIFDFYSDDPCPHIPGRTYDGQRCTYTVDNARLRHVGLVATGSNPNAKLLDTREWDPELLKIKQEGDLGTGATDPKSLLERDGLKWRQSLIDTAIQEGIRAEDDFDEATWRKRLETVESDQILAQTATWQKLGDARWGEGGRKTEDDPTHTPDSTEIVLPSYLFG